MADLPSLEGRTFLAIADVDGGEVGPATVFSYHESDGVVWASYEGGRIVRGFLVGSRHGDSLSFRYSQINVEGETSNGRCSSQISALHDGRLRISEQWAWESHQGSGTSTVEEPAQMAPKRRSRPS